MRIIQPTPLRIAPRSTTCAHAAADQGCRRPGAQMYGVPRFFRAAALSVMPPLLATLAACGEADRAGFQVIDEEGIPVAVNARPPADTLVLDEPTVRVGRLGEDVEFGRIGHMVALEDGGFLVADGMSGVSRFDAAGRYLHDIGRRGGGPGEFNEPSRLIADGDTVWVWSMSPPRLSLFRLGGSFVRTERLEKPSRGLPFHPTPAGVIDEVEWGQLIDPQPASATIVRRAGGSADTLFGPYPVPEFGWRIIDERTQVGMMVNPPVFSQRPPWVMCGEELVWGEPAAGELQVRNLSGTLLRRVRLAREPRRVSVGDQEAFVRTVVARFGGAEEDLDLMREGTDFAEYVPLITGLVCGDGGEIWVADFDPAVSSPSDAVGTTWDRVGPDGRGVARVRFPSGFRLQAVRGEHAYGVGVDELGVESAEIYVVGAAGGRE